MYAPIVIFAFNRLESLKRCVTSLLKNSEAVESDLFVFVDGPRVNKTGEKEKVEAVKEYVRTITGFKSLTTSFSEINKGLASSIIGGTTEVIEKYGKVIVLEDDLITSPSFLSYMNKMLDVYEQDDRIMQITGYSTVIRHHEKYHLDYYMTHRAHSWSWATWKKCWDSVDWGVKDFEDFAADKKRIRAFNEYGSDLFGMLQDWKLGKNNSWFIRFNYSMFKQGRYSIAPIQSLVRNDGFGNDATHCRAYNRYKIDFMNGHKTDWNVPAYLEWNKQLDKESIRYWSIPYRIYGKLRTKWELLWA